MADLKQKKVIEAMIENGGVVSKAMRTVGYSDAYSHNPHKLLNTQSFRQLANDMGLTDSFIIDALQADIASKTGNRVAELALASRIKGLLTDRIEVEHSVRDQYGKIAYETFAEQPETTPQEAESDEPKPIADYQNKQQ